MARRLEIIIDSPVAVKWFSEEEATARGLELRDSHVGGHATLITAPLLACEVANALPYKPDYDKAKLTEAMNHFYKLHLNEAPIDARLLSRSAEIAFEGDVTVYDAVPAALADLKKTRCITADQDTQYAKLKVKRYPIELL
jgi:predicted nucleic acid-binding protein